MKPEDREMPTDNLVTTSPAQEIPPFVGGKSEVLQFGEKKRRSLNPQVDERPVAPAQKSQLTPSMLRDCALPDYNGDSDEFILGGKVTAIEALQLYRDHYAKVAKEQGLVTTQEVDEVSPAEIIGAGGKKTIWLPVLWSRGQQIQMQKGTIAKQAREIRELTERVEGLRATVNRQAGELKAKGERIDELNDRLTREKKRAGDLQLMLWEEVDRKRPWWKRIFG